MDRKGHFDDTISNSKEESISKAIEIMLNDISSRKKVDLKRPKVSLLKGIILLILFIVSFVVLFFCGRILAKYIYISETTFRFILIGIFFMIVLIFFKRFIIWAILVYQKFAPSKIRLLCRFEPSCSEYMKISIQKYGVFLGVYKGIKRLLRCHYPIKKILNRLLKLRRLPVLLPHYPNKWILFIRLPSFVI